MPKIIPTNGEKVKRFRSLKPGCKGDRNILPTLLGKWY